jgi:PemK-like, MazF-like toxin of type II toxin-antitoxin system
VAWFFPLPDAGDIVWCRFPHRGFSVPGPKPRPALVVDIGHLRGEPAVEVVYGTSRKLDRLYPGEFTITPEDGDRFFVAGLDRPTKFDMKRSVFLPYTDEWFAVPPGAPFGQTPKLGLLHPSLVRRTRAARDATMRAAR